MGEAELAGCRAHPTSVQTRVTGERPSTCRRRDEGIDEFVEFAPVGELVAFATSFRFFVSTCALIGPERHRQQAGGKRCCENQSLRQP